MKLRHQLIGALCLNLLVVILGVIALILSLNEQGIGSFLFYTRDSNYLAVVVSLLFCIYAVRELQGKSEIPEWIYVLRYIAVSCLMVTFFVVIFVLMPMMEDNALFMLYSGSMLYQHTLCPLLAFISYFVLEIRQPLIKADIIKALIPTLTYAMITIILNVCRVIEGPYPFLMVYAQPWYASVLWLIIILGIAGFLAFAVRGLHNFIWKREYR